MVAGVICVGSFVLVFEFDFVGSVGGLYTNSHRNLITSRRLLIKALVHLVMIHTHVGTGWQYRPTVRAGISPIASNRTFYLIRM